MKKNFAAPPQGWFMFPERGGTTFNITSKDVTTQVDANKIFTSPYTNLFNKSSMLNTTGKKNADANDPYGYYALYDQIAYGDSSSSSSNSGGSSGGGGGFLSGLNLASLLQTAGTIYSNEQQIKLAEQQGKITADQAAKARAELAAAQAQAQIAQTQGQSTVDKIKAYAVPIAIIGVVGIAGIAAYFFFKKKKIQ